MQESSTSLQITNSKESDPVEEFVEYSILAGDYDSAAHALENDQQIAAAKTVKFVQLAEGFPTSKVTERHQSVSQQDSNAP